MSWSWSEVSSFSLHPRQHKPQGTEWAARLIPGVVSDCNRKKPPRGAGPSFLSRDVAGIVSADGAKLRLNLLTNTLLGGIQSEASQTWLQLSLRDCVLVMLNWVMVIPIWPQLHPVRSTLPLVPGPLTTIPIPPTLLSIAFLHGVLISLFNSPGVMRIADADLHKQMQALAKAIFWGTLVLSVALQMQGYSTLISAAIWSVGMLHFGALWGWRWAERDAQQRGVRTVRGARNVLIVGAGALGRRIASYVSNHPEMDRSVCGFLDDRKPLGNGIVGRTRDLMELARAGFVDEVILAPPHDQELTLRMLKIARQLHLDVKLAPELFGCEPGVPERLGSIPLISLHEQKLPVRGLLLKRLLDLAGAGTALILVLPALLAIAILIKIDSPGSVLYKAPRAGRKGRPFPCYKFRTMVKDADCRKESLREQNQRKGPFFKITDDPRVTKIGQFLRRYSLDELPQLWNVLRGEMSLVGPRPHPLDDVSAYSIEHLARLDVVPGITGLWQVTARQDPSFETGMNLDIEYIHFWSLGMDLRILLKTAGVVLRGSGN